MADPKQRLQMPLSTFLLLTVVIALSIILITNRIRIQSRINELDRQVDVFKEHLPEYHISRDIDSLEKQLARTIEFNGPTHPNVGKLEVEIKNLKRKKETAAILERMNQNKGRASGNTNSSLVQTLNRQIQTILLCIYQMVAVDLINQHRQNTAVVRRSWLL